MPLKCFEYTNGKVLLLQADKSISDVEKFLLLDNLSLKQIIGVNVEGSHFYLDNKNKIDDEIKNFGFSLFNLKKYNEYKSSMHLIVEEAYSAIIEGDNCDDV